MIKSFRIKNLRAFKDSGRITLSPLTVFVGKNSSGKSTLARMYPLVRQSVEANTKGPILWFGNQVDFGSFSTAICSRSDDKTIKLGFELEVESRRTPRYLSKNRAISGLAPQFNNLRVDMSLASDGSATVLNKFSIASDDISATIHRSSGRVEIAIECLGNVDAFDFAGGFEDSIEGGLLPRVTVKRKFKGMNRDGEITEMLINSSHEYKELIRKKSADKFLKYFRQTTNVNEHFRTLAQPIVYDRETMKKFLSKSFMSLKTFKTKFENDSDEVASAALRASWLFKLNEIIREVNEEIYYGFTAVKYIGPVRASAQRYYRFQDLQVDELDSKGSNLVMFINSMAKRQQDRLSSWINDNFGFEMRCRSEGPYYELKIRPHGYQEFHNLSDMGFGFSQILPILVSIFVDANNIKVGSTVGRRRLIGRERVHVIEQPELHLHPEMQSMVARLMARIVMSSSEIPIKFVIETHSKTFVDALGESIQDSELDSEDVSVYVVEPNGDGTSNVQKSTFDDEGYLVNWPVGFFSA